MISSTRQVASGGRALRMRQIEPPQMDMRADHHILENGEFVEKLEILKAAGDAERGIWEAGSDVMSRPATRSGPL